MKTFRLQRKQQKIQKFSAMGRASQLVQRARREAAVTPEILFEIESSQPCGPGAPIKSIEIRNLLTGKIARWTVLGGPRRNNFILRSPSGKTTRPHGAAWIMSKLRSVFIRF